MAVLALVALTAQAGMLVQPEPHWGGVAPRYSGYYCDGRLKRTVPQRLGKGLHGEVLLGESSSGGQQVAIKVGFRRGDIEREASVLAAMAGVPGFPTVLLNQPPNEQSKGGVLVMELLGPSLDELCQRIAPYTYLSGPTVMRVGRGALSPLHQLHLAGYVHNDVKPGNLLLGRGATASALHLIDFGLATLASDMCPDSAWRRDMLKGTPSFASLAAHYSRRPMRPVDDIESLVYTLAYLAAGGLPWEGLPEAEVAQLKKRAMTEGCHVFTDPIHSPTVATALRTIWAEVTRCRGDGRGPVGSPSRASNVDYGACMAALRSGVDGKEDVPYDWEERGQERADAPYYWSA